ncbi:MAG: FecCD family ABC transporter permease [Erysipelotrichaceae bacterium]
MKGKQKHWMLFSLGIGLLVVGLLFSISIGAKQIPFDEVLQYVFHPDTSQLSLIVWDVRLPRVLAAALVGGALAVAGSILQGITRNPIADPSIMGITQGATMVVSFALVALRLQPELVISNLALTLLAFLGAALSGVLVYQIGTHSRQNASTTRLVLAGCAMGTFFFSIATALTIATNLSQQLGFWLSGGLAGVTWSQVGLLSFFVVVAFVGSLLMSKQFNILQLGEEVAIGLGLHTNRVRMIALVLVIVLSGASVAVAGNIVFLGLIVPQFVRSIIGVDFHKTLPSTFVFGAVLLVYGDILARTINAPFETPVGALSALLGVPVFIYWIRKGRA